MTEENRLPTTHDARFPQDAKTENGSVSSTQNRPESETNEATLRQMTGAPDINQPLINKDAFADVDLKSLRPIWKLPVPKLAIIAVALVPVFGIAGYFLAGGHSSQQQATVPDESDQSTESDKSEDVSDLEQAEQEIASLKSQMALDDQAYIQDSQKPTTASASTNDVPNEPAISSPVVSSNPDPQADSVSSRSMPPIVNYSPSPPVRTTSDRMSSVSTSSPVPDSFVEVDPFAKWQQLAQLGSYGNVSNSGNNSPTETELAVNADSELTVSKSSGLSNAVPAAYFATTSATVPHYANIDLQEQATENQLSITPEKDRIDEPDILAEAESRILEEQVTASVSSTQSLVMGGSAAGELLTPVVIDNEGVGDQFMVVLAEPLTDNASRTAIPAGALLAVRVDRVAENGLVQLSATEAIWEEQGFQRELVLPSQAILIRGDDGAPLVAESYGDMGGDVAAMDMGQFALGAVRRVGELYTRSDSRVQTGDGTTVITESNPAPNILAGALEGGSEAILDAISDRNQRAIEKLQEQPRIPYIPAGSTVQVFINQSMQMPSGF